jgi:hypothetical protein
LFIIFYFKIILDAFARKKEDCYVCLIQRTFNGHKLFLFLVGPNVSEVKVWYFGTAMKFMTRKGRVVISRSV